MATATTPLAPSIIGSPRGSTLLPPKQPSWRETPLSLRVTIHDRGDRTHRRRAGRCIGTPDNDRDCSAPRGALAGPVARAFRRRRGAHLSGWAALRKPGYLGRWPRAAEERSCRRSLTRVRRR